MWFLEITLMISRTKNKELNFVCAYYNLLMPNLFSDGCKSRFLIESKLSCLIKKNYSHQLDAAIQISLQTSSNGKVFSSSKR
jgi:hypothetical protein